MTHKQKFNGYKNYATWNVALWIQNDESIYSIAKELGDYFSLSEYMLMSDLVGELQHRTPDGVAWDDSTLDLNTLNNLVRNL